MNLFAQPIVVNADGKYGIDSIDENGWDVYVMFMYNVYVCKHIPFVT